MKPVTTMTDEELNYVASDLRTAIAVTEPTRYSNLDRYVSGYRQVITEQETRERKRCFRRMIKDMPCDLLATIHPRFTPRIRYLHTARQINTGQEWRCKQGRSAMFQLGWERHHAS